MFKTSQPNPNRNDPDKESIKKKSGSEPQFETLVDFSKWLDQQLSSLESAHEDFSTSESIRTFFKRG